ncbi:MAG: hypothetical protein EOP51_21135 [Sphingobacteriales bacterium]|nr:MAG: hypothetical protein EOP51_21135 [Sphingobacteriales bacterium]
MFKKFDDVTSALHMMQRMTKLQSQHNQLRTDLEELIAVTEVRMETHVKNDAFIRSCISELFTLIESDVLYINLIDPAENYDDWNVFIDRFKDVFKAHCINHKYENIYNNFASKNLSDFKHLRAKRNKITHPKEKTDTEVNKQLFQKMKKVFTAYSRFVVDIMTGTGVEFSIASMSEFTNAIQNR